jgi:hypothetical protein
MAEGVDTNIGGVHVWAGPLTGGNYVFALDNRDKSTTIGTALFSLLEVPGVGDSSSMCIRDLFNGKSLGVHVGNISLPVPSHDTIILKAFPGASTC